MQYCLGKGEKATHIVIIMVIIVLLLPVFACASEWQDKAINSVNNGDGSEIIRMVKDGLDVNSKFDDGWSLLMVAAVSDHDKLARFLINRGSDVNATESYKNMTALMIAASSGSLNVCNTLLNNGAKINKRDVMGSTALIKAAEGSHYEVVKVLVERGADVNAQWTLRGTSGNALHAAVGIGASNLASATENAVKIIELLLANGINSNFKGGNRGRTPLEQAIYEKGEYGGNFDPIIKALRGSVAPPVASNDNAKASKVDKPMSKAKVKKKVVRKPKETRDCSDCPIMVEIPVGIYKVAYDQSELKRETATEGQTTRPYLLAKYEITREQYRAFLNQSGYKASQGCWADGKYRSSLNWDDPGFYQEQGDPVVCVSYDDASAYVEWLKKKTGKKYSLPDFIDYLPAIASNNVSPYMSRYNSEVCAYGNFSNVKESHSTLTCSDQFPETAPVGSFKPTDIGVYDVLGNVSEILKTKDSSRVDSFNSDYKDNSFFALTYADSLYLQRNGYGTDSLGFRVVLR